MIFLIRVKGIFYFRLTDAQSRSTSCLGWVVLVINRFRKKHKVGGGSVNA
jgi:hypothetical protein